MTPNFGKETPAESVRLAPNLVLPASGTLGRCELNHRIRLLHERRLDRATDFAYFEVGIVTLTPRIADGDYLGAPATSSARRRGNVGRFTPNDFLVTTNTPSF